MKLNDARTQEELKTLVNKTLLRNLLADSPLNLPRIFLYALCFTFMPGGILGPALGVVSTAVLAGVAGYLWLWGSQERLDSFLWFWLVWALVDLLLLVVFRMVVGIWQFCLFRKYLPAEEAEVEPMLRPGSLTLLEFEAGQNDKPELLVQVPARGIYVLSVKVEDEDAQVDVRFDGCACMEEHEHVPGLVHVCLAAYRLEPGCHTLALQVQSSTASRLAVSFR